MRRSPHARGITLVELMIVVAIVGILSVIAIVGWRKLTNASHVAEATQMVGGIRAAQDRYKSEVGHFAHVSANLGFSQGTHHDALYPHCTTSPAREPGNFKVAWGAACNATCCSLGSNPTWQSLQMTVDAPVYYGYSTISGGTSTAPPTIPIGNTNLSWPNPLPGEWYVATGVGDVDGNHVFSTVIGTSLDNQIRVDMEGE